MAILLYFIKFVSWWLLLNAMQLLFATYIVGPFLAASDKDDEEHDWEHAPWCEKYKERKAR